MYVFNGKSYTMTELFGFCILFIFILFILVMDASIFIRFAILAICGILLIYFQIPGAIWIYVGIIFMLLVTSFMRPTKNSSNSFTSMFSSFGQSPTPQPAASLVGGAPVSPPASAPSTSMSPPASSATPSPAATPPKTTGGGKIKVKTNIFTPLLNLLGSLNSRIMYLNNSKFFAGVVMILLNVGSKFITIQFSKSTEEYMKYTVSKQLLVFSMAWMGTRDIYTALGLTAVFTILSEHLFNEESRLCIVPEKCRVLFKKDEPENSEPKVTDLEIASAVATLEKAKKDKQRLMQREAFSKFDFERYN